MSTVNQVDADALADARSREWARLEELSRERLDGARFVGHLTLARINRGLPAVRWLEILDSFPRWRWHVDELCLVESHPGARYVVTERFPLGGS